MLSCVCMCVSVCVCVCVCVCACEFKQMCMLRLLSQEKQAANTCTVRIIYGPVYAYTTGKIRVPVSVTTGPSIPRNGTVLLRELPY